MVHARSPSPLSPGETTVATEDGILAAAREIREEEEDETPGEKAEEARVERERPYSIFKPWEKWFIVFMTSMAGIFSPLSANIYFPSIPVLADAFSVPIESINVTVTVYMILQGISPILWGSLADSSICGRRPVYLSCLLLFCITCVGLAVTPTSMYWLLLLMRCLQAAGCASVIALGAGTIMDIAARAERGTYLGVSALGPMIGPALGPVAGGLLAGELGWRWVFWFMCIACGFVLVLEFIFLPETLRAIVGDGSIAPPRLNRPLVPILGRSRTNQERSVAKAEASRANTPLDTLKLLRNIDLTIILATTAIPYSVFYAIITSTSPVFLDVFPWLTEVDLGLCFLANGIGSLVGSITSGRLLDWDWARAKRHAKEKGVTEYDYVEHARLRTSPFYWIMFVLFTIAYGWTAAFRVHIAALLVFQFFAGWALSGIFTSNQTLMMDLFPGRGASVTACNNLVRCLTGSVVVSVVDFSITNIGAGWTFTIMGLATAATAWPLTFIEWKYGKGWRKQREARQAKGGD
ncbi:MFS general substrate transporter [Calocera cornea HHB12733]|uniref:MFS general substrate transporter n=1 Tax=Calocera cornea HHB12733 TaxID=1353952 RepID=A0A165E750_9BASI|nr:MFS general substrate transporter [Calocera cornea HHB12733]